MGCVCSTPGGDGRSQTPEDFTGPSRTMLARRKPRVLAVIAAWSRPGDVGNGALPRTRSNVVPSPLADVGGHPMVYHAWFAATKARCVARCVIATDEDDVQSAAVWFGAVVVRVDPYEEGMNARHAKRDKSTQKEYSAIGAAAFALRKAQALFLKSTDPEDRTEFDVVVVIDADELFVQAHHIEITADAVINSDAAASISTRARNSGEHVFNRDSKRALCSIDANGYVTKVFSMQSFVNSKTESTVATSNTFEGSNGSVTNTTNNTLEPSDSPTSPLVGVDVDFEFAASGAFEKEAAKDRREGSKSKTVFADADSDSVVVEVGVRSYTAAALLRVLDGGQDGCETSEEDKINDEVRHDPSREALRKHGWRVKAVKSLERELGGVKSMKSLDAAVAGKARNRT